jgi:hypothetical protein
MPRESDYLPASLRKVVRDRARNLCEYCCCPADYSSDPFTVDHTQPRQAGGKAFSKTLPGLAKAVMAANISELPSLIPKPSKTRHSLTRASKHGRIISSGVLISPK